MASKTTLRTCFVIFYLLLSLCMHGKEKQRIKQILHNNPNVVSYLYKDSLVFYYSGKRGSVFNPHRLNGVDYGFPFDSPLRFSNYPAATLPLPMFDINELSAQYDSLQRYNSTYEKRLMYTAFKATYINDSLLSGFGAGLSPKGFASETAITFNENYQPSVIYNMMYNDQTKKTDTTRFRNIYYDMSGRPATDSTWASNAYDNVFFSYTYNNAGLLETIIESRPFATGIYNFTRTTYTYNAKGGVTRVLKQYFDEDVFITFSKEELEYDAANRLTSHIMYDGDNGIIGYKREVVYDNKGEPYLHDIQYYSGGNLYSCELVEVYFNEYHNPDSAITWTDNCHIGLTQRSTTQYIYETYESGEDDDDTGSVMPKRKPFIYPNPAHNLVHIRWHKDFSKQPLEIKLYNSAGQEMRRYFILTPSETDDFNIQGLAAGVYLLRINTAGQEYIYSGKLLVL